MKKYLLFLKYALKEQRQYRTNFLVSIATMVFNDACFLVIFIIFLGYFTGTGLTMGNFLVLFGLTTAAYGVTHGLLCNIWGLSDIIEKGKLDYYLSFPVNPLGFLAFSKVGMTDLGDILFGLICLFVYAFGFADSPAWIILLKGLVIFIVGIISIVGIYIAVGSISFWLQKGSKIQDLFNSMFLSLSQYPPEIYKENKMVYLFVCVLLFPSVLLPYYMMIGNSTLGQRLLLIGLSIVIFVVGIRVFKIGLKRYSSGNLVHQM